MEESSELTQLHLITYEIVVPVIICVGLLLNTAGLASFTSSEVNRDNATYVYALYLGSSNVAVMLFSIPFVIHKADMGGCRSWLGAFYEAHLELPLINTFVALSIHILVWMSVGRYLSVYQPTSFQRFQRKNVARAVMSTSVLVAVLTQGPLSVMKKMVPTGNGSDPCSNWTCMGWITSDNVTVTSTRYWTAYLWTAQCLSRFVPCAALVGFNFKLIFKFRSIFFKRNRIIAARASNDDGQLNADETRLLILLSCMVALFVVCIIPAGVFTVQYNMNADSGRFVYQMAGAISNALELFNSAVIFFLFCLCNGDIHQRFTQLIGCKSSQ